MPSVFDHRTRLINQVRITLVETRALEREIEALSQRKHRLLDKVRKMKNVAMDISYKAQLALPKELIAYVEGKFGEAGLKKLRKKVLGEMLRTGKIWFWPGKEKANGKPT